MLTSTLVHAAPVATATANPSVPFFGDVENFKSKSLSLQTEKQNLEATSDLYLSRKFFWTPKLSVSANSTQTKLNSKTAYDANYIEADLSMNLFRAGGDWNSMQDASAQKKAQELQVFNESLRVEARAADLIFKSLYLIETERIQDQLLKLKEESLRIVNDRFHQGRLPLQEVAKSEVDLTQQKNKLRSAHLDFVENKSLISSLFVNELQTKVWPFNEKVSPRLATAPRLPLVEQKYWVSESKQEIWKATKAGHWPSLDFTIQYQDTKVKDPATATSQQYIGLLTLSLPIWNRYETAAQVSSAYAQYVTSTNDFKDTEQSLKQKTQFLKEKIEIARLNLSEAKKNVEASRKLYQDILRSFRLGRLSTNDLLLEQNRLLDSENALALSQLTFHQGLIETCVLAGFKTSECLQ
ncbi:MAG: TolC family protein [Bdellovibrio sp.]|nr:TolC family protein [Bdellovibrio sp.]